MNQEIKFIKPKDVSLVCLQDFKDQMLKEAPYINGGSNLEKYDDLSLYLKYLESLENKETCPNFFVPSVTFLLLVKSEIVGISNIRLELNENLLKVGGHIGYSILPTKRNKGYGTMILEKSIAYLKSLNINKILVTCNKDNMASKRVIIKNNGKLENTILCGKDEIERYWINLC